MIIKASQRGGAMQLGAHLLKAENEHVEIHEIRGFVADNVLNAMKEAQAVAMGSRAKQHLFSVSLNPPETEAVSTAAFETAIGRIEEQTGLIGQPRIVVFHEKEGRRHCHVVWSRIDADTMKAVPLPFFKTKLREIGKQLYLEHGWEMPRGFVKSTEQDPRTFSLAEWQQAKRIGRDPRQLKALVQECWAVADSGAAFSQVLEKRGLYLARGDRRAFVAVTYEGEVLSIARMIGKKSKDVVTKLGPPENARSVDDTKKHIAETVAPRLQALINEADKARTRELTPLEQRRQDMRTQHTQERERMAQGQQARTIAETRARAERFRSGMAGLWDRFSGKHAQIRQENDRDAFNSFQRDRTQRDVLVTDQLRERRGLQKGIQSVRHRHAARVLDLHRDLSYLRPDAENSRETIAQTFSRHASSLRSPPTRQSSRGTQGPNRDRGPDLGR